MSTHAGGASLRLGDGRRLAYAERGSPEGKPVLNCHGLPGSRLECWGSEAACVAAGVRLITVDRPGIGRSDKSTDWGVWRWPRDVAALMGALSIDRFAVAGHSAGAAYALACAYALPERVTCTAIVGGVPQLDRAGGVEELGTRRAWKLAETRPALMRATLATWRWLLRATPRLGHELFFRHASPVDRVAVDRPGVRQRFRYSALEAMRQGAGALVDDMRTLLRPWGFSPDDVGSAVQIWHGSDDRHVAPRVAERYARRIPQGEAQFLGGEGHFSLFENRASEILSALVRCADL